MVDPPQMQLCIIWKHNCSCAIVLVVLVRNPTQNAKFIAVEKQATQTSEGGGRRAKTTKCRLYNTYTLIAAPPKLQSPTWIS